MKDKSKKGSGWIKAIIMLLVGIVVGLGAYYGYDNYLSKDSKDEKTNNEVVDDVSFEVKQKLSHFIDAASIDDSVASDYITAKYFNKGTTKISDEMKLKMVYNATLRYAQDNHIIDKSEIDEMVDSTFNRNESSEIVGEPVTIVRVEDFNQEYEDFFGEKPKYTIKDIKKLGCPMPLAMSKTDIYLFHRCGGTTVMSYNSIIDYYKKDGDKYLVHTTGQEFNSATEEVTKTYKTIWTFDKDLKFVSTEKE